MKFLKLFAISTILFFSSINFSEEDPFRKLNETTHNLNDTLDLSLASPIAKFYKNITPDFIENGITNFIRNVEDLNIGINNILQGKYKSGASDFFRFSINTSLGLVGLVDVATHLGFKKNDEDFGQTLAVWGVSNGPYVVLPGFGPSTMRDTLAMIPDSFLNPFWFIDHVSTRNSIRGLDLINTRARYLGLETIVIGDEYLFFKDAYLQSREFEINDGEIEDDFDEFDDFN